MTELYLPTNSWKNWRECFFRLYSLCTTQWHSCFPRQIKHFSRVDCNLWRSKSWNAHQSSWVPCGKVPSNSKRLKCSRNKSKLSNTSLCQKNFAARLTGQTADVEPEVKKHKTTDELQDSPSKSFHTRSVTASQASTSQLGASNFVINAFWSLMISVWKSGPVRSFGLESLGPGPRPVLIFSDQTKNRTEPVWTGPERFFAVPKPVPVQTGSKPVWTGLDRMLVLQIYNIQLFNYYLLSDLFNCI